MLTQTEFNVLNSLALDLARRGFGGTAGVQRLSNGVARLTIATHAVRGLSVHRERDIESLTFAGASKEITLVMDAAAAEQTRS